MKYIPANRYQAQAYLDHLRLVDDIKTLRDIAKTFVKGHAESAKVEYEQEEAGMSNCAVQVEFYDKDGSKLELKKKFAGFDDVPDAIEDEWADTLGAYLAGSDDKWYHVFDLVSEPMCRLTLYVEEK